MSLVVGWSAVALAAAVMLYLWRRSPWRSIAVIAGAALALGAAFLLTGDSVAYLFERAAATFAGTVIASMLSVLLVRTVLPRLHLRAHKLAAALLCACLAAVFTVVGLMLWRTADDGLQLSAVPSVDTAEEILAWRNAEPHTRIYGVLVQARLTPDASREGAAPEPVTSESASPDSDRAVLARIDCGRTGSGLSSLAQTWLPSGYQIELADGSQAWVQGIESARQAWNWPRGGDRINECVLYSGDPVVIWGDPAKMRPVGGDEELPAVNAVRVLGYGDAEAFRDEFVPAAQRTGRATLALAALNAALAVWMCVIGWRQYRRLDRDGRDQPDGTVPNAPGH